MSRPTSLARAVWPALQWVFWRALFERTRRPGPAGETEESSEAPPAEGPSEPPASMMHPADGPSEPPASMTHPADPTAPATTAAPAPRVAEPTPASEPVPIGPCTSLSDPGCDALAPRLEAALTRAYVDLRARRADRATIDRATIEAVLGQLLSDDTPGQGGMLPPRLAEELRRARAGGRTPIGDLADLLEASLADDEREPEAVGLQLMLRLLSWHAFDRVRDRAEHASREVRREHPPIAPHHVWRLRLHLLVRLAVALTTAVATFVGTLHLSGWLLDAFEVPLTPRQHQWARYAMSAVLGLTTSWVVLRMKRHLDRHLLHDGRPLLPSIRGAYRDWLLGRREARGGPLAEGGRSAVRGGTRPSLLVALVVGLLVTAVLVADVYTNFTGGAAFFAARRDRLVQLETVQSELDRRLVGDAEQPGVRRQLLGTSAALAGEAEGFVEQILRDEAGGRSYTETAGQGPLYHAKRLLLLEDPGSRRWLESAGSPLASALLDVVTRAPVVGDGLSLPEELSSRARDAEGDARGILDDIEARRAALSPRHSIEELQQRIDEITGRPGMPGRFDALRELHEGLQADVEAHRRTYNGVLQDIASVAETVGGYPVAAGSIEALEVEPIAVDTAPIEVPQLQFREATELVRSAWQNFSAPLAALILLASALGAVGFSYLDVLLGSHGPLELRTVHARDRERAERLEAHLLAVRRSVVEVLDRVLHEGPFAGLLTTSRVPRERLAAAVDRAVDDVAGAPTRREARALARAVAERGRHTVTARRANRRLRAFRRVLASPDGVDGVLRSVTTELVGYRPDARLRPVGLAAYHPDRRALIGDMDDAVDRQTLDEVERALASLRIERGTPEELSKLGERVEGLRAELARCRRSPHGERCRALEDALERRLAALPRDLESRRRAERRRAVERMARRILDELGAVVVSDATLLDPDEMEAERQALLSHRITVGRALAELHDVAPDDRVAPRPGAEAVWERADEAARRLEGRVEARLTRLAEMRRRARGLAHREAVERRGVVRAWLERWLQARRLPASAGGEGPDLPEVLYETGFLLAPFDRDRASFVDRAELMRAVLALSAYLQAHLPRLRAAFDRAAGDDLAELT